MLREERLERMVRIVREKGCVTTAQLSAYMGFSESTVRRDLAHLEERRVILRNRNGAVLYPQHHTETSVHFRAAVNAQAKEKIAACAARLVPDGSLLFLDSSSTVLSMANFLTAKKNLTIVTNSLLLAMLMRDTHQRLVLTGGEFYAPSHAFYGELAVEGVRRFNFDFCFVSSVSVTRDGYAAEALAHSVPVRQEAIRRSEQAVLLCDRSKMGLHRPYNLISIDEMDYVITDDPVQPAHTAARVLRV